MPSFVFRRVSPSDDELRLARQQAVEQALRDLARRGVVPEQFDYPDWSPLLDAAASQPEGVVVLHWTVSWRHPPGVVFGAAWWTDPVGRQHWYLEQALPDEHSRFYRDGHGDDGLDLAAGHHPLEWLMPPASCGWRERGGAREFLVVCGCGVAGTPADIAWAGDCCGPCFDQKQDGLPVSDLPPSRPAIGAVTSFALAPDGRLVTVRAAADDGTSAGTTVKAWAPPWAAPAPLWTRRIPEVLIGTPSCSDRAVALFDGRGYLVLLSLAGGQPIDAHEESAFSDLQSLSFVQTIGALAGTCLPWSDHGGLSIWPRTAAGKVGPRAHRRAGDFTQLATQPGGIRVAVGGPAGTVEVHEAVRGGLIERLRSPVPGYVEGLAVAPDTTVLAAVRCSPPNHTLLARWGPATPPPANGPSRPAWRARQAERPADTAHHLKTTAHSLALAPDGRYLAAVVGAGALGFWEVASLAEKARLTLSVPVIGPVAFAPDGRSLLVNTGAGLAVYPWKELLGLR